LVGFGPCPGGCSSMAMRCSAGTVCR
jgi:hypothetical protein